MNLAPFNYLIVSCESCATLLVLPYNILVRQNINRLHQHKHKFEDKAICKFLIVCQDFGRQTLKGHGTQINPTQQNKIQHKRKRSNE